MAKQASEVSRVHDLYYCISRDEDNGFTLSIKNGNCLDSAIFLYTAIFQFWQILLDLAIYFRFSNFLDSAIFLALAIFYIYNFLWSGNFFRFDNFLRFFFQIRYLETGKLYIYIPCCNLSCGVDNFSNVTPEASQLHIQSWILPFLCSAVHLIIPCSGSFFLLCFLVLFIIIPKAGWNATK